MVADDDMSRSGELGNGGTEWEDLDLADDVEASELTDVEVSDDELVGWEWVRVWSLEFTKFMNGLRLVKQLGAEHMIIHPIELFHDFMIWNFRSVIH